MRFSYLLVATAAAFLSRLVTAEQAIDSSRRFVRVAGTTDDVRSATEERGFLSQIADDIGSMANRAKWVNADKTDDFVKQALGLEKLSEQALKASPKFKVLEEFQRKMDEKKVKAWLYEDTTTAEVWKILGLDKLTKAEIKNSDALRTYVRYATRLDDDIWNLKRASFEPDLADPKELAVKIKLWAKAGRPRDYVFEIMGKNALKGSPNYKYYQRYAKLLKASSR
jgi:hypothetical protein